MNRLLILFFGAFLNATFCVLSSYAASDPTESALDPPMGQQETAPPKKNFLSNRVVRMPLNQNEPTEVKVGVQGVTTLQFPAKIEAINGYGFALQPNLDTDAFSLIYDKGTNFLSLKALRAGVSANLSVVINEKVYCFFCEADSDPSFVMIFGAPGEKETGTDGAQIQSATPQKKEASREQLVGFLGKLKDYGRLKAVSADSISTLAVAEPNKKSATGDIETVIKRIVRDDSLGLMGFEVDLSNRGQSDYYLDPQGFGIRVGDASYDESISDCGGIVPAGTSVPAFFVISDATNGGRNNLAVDQNFEIQIRASDAGSNPTLTENFVEPPSDRLPGANLGKQSGNKVRTTQKEPVKEAKVTTKKGLQDSGPVNGKDRAVKAGDSPVKKHWFDLFRRSSNVTVE
jgi:hypothetical protein